jgi:FeS assembly SUF system protein
MNEPINLSGPIPDLQRPTNLKEKVIEVLQTCYDPEIPVNIYELGLVYSVDVNEETGEVGVRMTLTSPACPVAGSLPPEVEAKIRAVPGASKVGVEVVWDPPWTPDKMSEAAKLQLNMM